MKHIRILAAVIAALVVLAVSLLAMSRSKEPAEPAPAVKTVQVVAAAKDIPAYTVISADMVTVAVVPESAVAAGAYTRAQDVVGAITLGELAPGEVVLANHIRQVSEGQTPLAPDIPEGFRAMTVTVGDDTGVAQLIKVGNHVDVIAVADDSQEKDQVKAVMLLEDVTVLALDRRVADPSVYADQAEASDALFTYNTVTLAVTPDDAVKLAAATGKGTLYLTLRGQDDSLTVGAVRISTRDLL